MQRIWENYNNMYVRIEKGEERRKMGRSERRGGRESE